MANRPKSRWLPLAIAAFGLQTALTAAPIAALAQTDRVQPIEVTARPITRFQATDPRRQRFGPLEFRGGLVLSSENSAFGGWSGLTVEPDGKRFLAVSDEGTWLSGEIAYDGTAPAGIRKASIGPIRALKGRHLDKKRDLDAEAIRALDGSLTKGTVLVGFERNHRIGVFPVIEGSLEPPTRYLKLPVEARRMKANKGFEAVAVLRDGPYKGSVVAFSERFPGEISRHAGWLWVNGEPQRIELTDIGDFEITDAASLADGRLLILERRFRWTEGVKMRLRLIAAEAVRPGARLDGEVLIEADLASEIDNMEGLAVHRAPAGETVLTLISDNNFNSLLQRNVLLQFTLTSDGKAAGRP
ncbi:MAG: esterase-like activity of phytase family protein [Hyphomicrobiaceae bacterium]|nr:esterase-like activity of phytase family protein [Hyphomicrobiaceae bacterium]